MHGKVVSMDKPMVLLKKRVCKLRSFMDRLDEDDDDVENCRLKIDTEEMSDEQEEKTKTEYVIQLVIKRKLIFNKRPRPIVHIESNKKF
jgi:hypothetical protein